MQHAHIWVTRQSKCASRDWPRFMPMCGDSQGFLTDGMKTLTWQVHHVNLNKIIIFLWKCNCYIGSHHQFHVKSLSRLLLPTTFWNLYTVNHWCKVSITLWPIFILRHLIKFPWIIKQRIKAILKSYHSYKHLALISSLIHMKNQIFNKKSCVIKWMFSTKISKFLKIFFQIWKLVSLKLFFFYVFIFWIISFGRIF